MVSGLGSHCKKSMAPELLFFSPMTAAPVSELHLFLVRLRLLFSSVVAWSVTCSHTLKVSFIALQRVTHIVIIKHNLTTASTIVMSGGVTRGLSQVGKLEEGPANLHSSMI